MKSGKKAEAARAGKKGGASAALADLKFSKSEIRKKTRSLLRLHKDLYDSLKDA